MVALTVSQSTTTIIVLAEWRCPSCGRLLARVDLAPGSLIEVKCEKCGAVVQLSKPS